MCAKDAGYARNQTTKTQQAFMGHSFIFGILLDTLLSKAEQDQRPHRGKVSPADNPKANINNFSEMGLEGTLAIAVRFRD